MKKIFAVLFLITFLIVLAAPLAISATTTNCCRIKNSFSLEGETWTSGTCYGQVGAEACARADNTVLCATTILRDNWGMGCVLNTVYRISDLIFTILIAACIITVLVAAGIFLTAGGAPEKVNKARDFILYAVVGLIVAFFAKIIPSIVATLI